MVMGSCQREGPPDSQNWQAPCETHEEVDSQWPYPMISRHLCGAHHRNAPILVPWAIVGADVIIRGERRRVLRRKQETIKKPLFKTKPKSVTKTCSFINKRPSSVLWFKELIVHFFWTFFLIQRLGSQALVRSTTAKYYKKRKKDYHYCQTTKYNCARNACVQPCVRNPRGYTMSLGTSLPTLGRVDSLGNNV